MKFFFGGGVEKFQEGLLLFLGGVNFFGKGDIFSGGVGNFLGGRVEIFSGGVGNYSGGRVDIFFGRGCDFFGRGCHFFGRG